MQEAFSVLGIFRFLILGQHTLKFHGKKNGIYHFVFGRAGVNAYSMKGDESAGSIEVFILQFPTFSSVHGIGKICAEFFHIKMVGSLSDFLVWCESNANRTMRDFRVCKEIFRGCENFRNSCLVITA